MRTSITRITFDSTNSKTNMKIQFRIYKEGVTPKPIRIETQNGMWNGQPFNKAASIAFYKSLGYIIL